MNSVESQTAQQKFRKKKVGQQECEWQLKSGNFWGKKWECSHKNRNFAFSVARSLRSQASFLTTRSDILTLNIYPTRWTAMSMFG